MATQLNAYAGKILKIDLTDRKVCEYPFSDELRKLFLGGKVMAAKILYDNISGPIDPLSKDNMLVISTGPLNGMGGPCSSRFNISAISPLTNILTSSNCGGPFGLSLKRAGYDALIITGKSEERIYLEILADNVVNFKNADALWGLKTGPAQEAIPEKGGKVVIGPAGENLVKFACAVSGDRAAGRGGVGAVFGSKNLKGIVAYGNKTYEAYDKEKLVEHNKVWVKRLKDHPTTGVQLPKLGTAALVAPMHAKHLLATHNYQTGSFENFEDISGETLSENNLVRNKGCLTCPIQCARVVEVEGHNVKGPEVETLGLLGPNILNNNLALILKWNFELDEFGMDTISFANTIAYAMELKEREMADLSVEFGKTDNISEIIEMTAKREGVGNELAEGSRNLTKKYGGIEFAMQVKGMELAAYEPRAAVGQGLGYAIANRGGCHLNGGYMVVAEGLGLSINQYTNIGKAGLTIMFQNLMEGISAGGNCLFTSYAFFPIPLLTNPTGLITRIVNKCAHLFGGIVGLAMKVPDLLAVNLPKMLPHPLALKYATGMKFNMGKLLKVGMRGYNLERALNVKLGIDKKDDVLPKRLMEEAQLKDNERSKVNVLKMRKAYYFYRGWDKCGIPKHSLLKRLKIEN